MATDKDCLWTYIGERGKDYPHTDLTPAIAANRPASDSAELLHLPFTSMFAFIASVVSQLRCRVKQYVEFLAESEPGDHGTPPEPATSAHKSSLYKTSEIPYPGKPAVYLVQTYKRILQAYSVSHSKCLCALIHSSLIVNP